MQPLATGFQWSHCLSDALATTESALHGDAVDMTLVTWVSASNGSPQDFGVHRQSNFAVQASDLVVNNTV